MNQALMLVLALVCGGLLGAAFFLGLQWTVSKAMTTSAAALLFPLSFLVRAAVVLGGFYLLSGGDWRRLLACLLGFSVARAVVIKLGNAIHGNPKQRKAAGYAP